MHPNVFYTTAIDNDQVRQAVVLAASLRKIYVNDAKLGVLIPADSEISEGESKCLREAFEPVVKVQTKKKPELELVSQLWTLNDQRIVYIQHDRLVVSPLDDLFARETAFQAMYHKNLPDCFDTSLFAYCPDMTIAGQLETKIKSSACSSVDALLNAQFNDWLASKHHLSRVYGMESREKYEIAYRAFGEPKVVYFDKIAPWSYVKSKEGGYDSEAGYANKHAELWKACLKAANARLVSPLKKSEAIGWETRGQKPPKGPQMDSSMYEFLE